MRNSTHLRRSVRVLSTMCLASLALTASRLEAQTQIGMEIGSQAEPFALETVYGEFVDLADVVGRRPVLLEFWASWCSKCQALHAKMEAAYEKFGDRVEFYGVAVAVGQKPSTIRRYLDKHPTSFPMLWDKSGDAVRQFMVPVTSYIVILDAEGRVAYTGVDSSQDILGALQRIVGNGQSESETS